MNRCASLLIVLAAILAASLPAMAEVPVIDLGPEEFVQANGEDIVVPGYSVPCFEDWDNDGLGDLIVGEGDGDTGGKVRVYLNRGSEVDPSFVDSFYVQADGWDLKVPAQGCLGAAPRVVYWDWDDAKDLLIGRANGTVEIYLNIASDEDPSFDSGHTVNYGGCQCWPIDVGMRATPVPVYWNDDDMLDLVVGGLDGMIHVYMNCGCGGSIPPRFNYSPMAGEPAQEDGQDLIVPGLRSSPDILDLDGDGKKDLLTGNSDGQILFYKNIGLEGLPLFGGFSLVCSNGEPIDLAGSPRSRPFVCHWDGPGHWDLLVGSADGKIRLYRGSPAPGNPGDPGEPGDPADPGDVGTLGDFNGDGRLDADDFTFIARALNKPLTKEGSPADLNADGMVDGHDLTLFAELWLAEYGDDEPKAEDAKI